MRHDFDVDLSRDFMVQRDAIAIGVRCRFAIAAPVIGKSLRRLDVGGTPLPGVSPIFLSERTRGVSECPS